MKRGVLGVLLALAAAVPAVALADHIVTAATVDARLKERRHVDFWAVEIRWTAGCNGAQSGKAWYDGHLTMIDADTGERIYVGGVVNTSGSRSVSETREWWVSSIGRERHLIPELRMSCYENFPLHGGREVTVTGTAVFIPPRVGRSGGGPGGAGGDYGSSDPTSPAGPGSGGCTVALVGTNGRDTLRGGAAGDVVFGLGGADRLDGRAGNDCLLGGSGNDVLRGEAGADRLTGGRGDDVLVGGPGLNAYDAGPGADRIEARNGVRETIRCGSGRDTAIVDRNDRVVGCEVVRRPR